MFEKDYWMVHNLRFSKPYFRIEKCARIVNSLSRRKKILNLLDVGCGPATLENLLQPDINYFGIDIAIQNQAPNLIELDIRKNEIKFDEMKFDMIVALGLFEYFGGVQSEKLREIKRILNPNGIFLVIYSNFHHINAWKEYPAVNNIQSIQEFKKKIQKYFKIDKIFPCSHNWFFSEPKLTKLKWLKKIQMNLKTNLPIISPLLTVNYVLLCSHQQSLAGKNQLDLG